ncbi:hypothetical protein H0H81_001622 [Sphagnurus paluster]|uniref:AB hydrolase-1 domain-containing protein n=1 Tax=Sphagnurus paluster TaxID=117069 RepID=A0A9P7GNS6_9AGAR|nr:hypothetical protein H0H81_001622 [Sphagnurus paluster]
MANTTLRVEIFTFPDPGTTNLKAIAKRYTSTSGIPEDGITLLFAHSLGSHKEQWEPTIRRIFHLQKRKDIRNRIREAWAFDWQSHGDAGVANQDTLKSRQDAVSASEWGLALESFVRGYLKGHRVVALGHSAGTGAIMMSLKNTPIHKPPYIAVFLIEPTIIAQDLFTARTKERERSANMSKKMTLERRDTWPNEEAAAAYLRRRLPWKSWDTRVFDIYIKEGLQTVTTPDGEVVALKTSKRQEGLAYPHFTPYIEAAQLFKERCTVIPFHVIFGANIDFVPRYIQESLCDASQGRKPASVTKVPGAGHLYNVTVNNTSPSIEYGGNAGDASICKINPDGTLVPGQPGCYAIPSQCTKGVSMSQGASGTASFSFNGTAIYIESALDSLSPIYTITLDGQSTDVDGVRQSAPFICAPLYSQTGLDPTVEHSVKLSVKGPSPNRNTSITNSENFFTFSLISFTYTATSGENNTDSARSASAGLASKTDGATPAASGTSVVKTAGTSSAINFAISAQNLVSAVLLIAACSSIL